MLFACFDHHKYWRDLFLQISLFRPTSSHNLIFEMRRKRKKKRDISGCQLAAIALHYAGGRDIDDGGGGGLYDGTDGVNQGE